MRRSGIHALVIVVALTAWARASEPRQPEPSAKTSRTPEEVKAYIDQQGRERPEWWNSVELTYPSTLDLSWPLQPSGAWDARKNVGQYIWDVVNPNPGRWREGIRLVHQLLLQHQNDPAKRERAMRELGSMYYRFEQDYARAAFWWQHAGIRGGAQSGLVPQLADCYWKLGSKELAYETLRQGPFYYNSIKVLADMGETDTALLLAERFANTSRPDLAFLYAGDACRQVARYDDAIAWYTKVLATTPGDSRFQNAFALSKDRARANIAAIKVFDRLDLNQVPDGAYEGKAMAYGGDLEVRVTVRGGRIADVTVLRHHEKQFYSALTDTPRQIVEKQGIRGVDAVTGATITSEAIVNAVAHALATSMK